MYASNSKNSKYTAALGKLVPSITSCIMKNILARNTQTQFLLKKESLTILTFNSFLSISFHKNQI